MCLTLHFSMPCEDRKKNCFVVFFYDAMKVLILKENVLSNVWCLVMNEKKNKGIPSILCRNVCIVVYSLYIDQ